MLEGNLHVIGTNYGTLGVTVYGDTSKPAMVTYHDIGTTHSSCFDRLIDADREYFDKFCLYQVDAPGNHANADPKFPVPYLSTTELAEQVSLAMVSLGVKRYVGMGAGYGGTILLKLSTLHPDDVISLILFTTTYEKHDWLYWASLKVEQAKLLVTGINQGVTNFLLGRHLSLATLEANYDVVNYLSEESKKLKYQSFKMMFSSYINQTVHVSDLKATKCECLLLAGRDSPRAMDSMWVFGEIPKENSVYDEMNYSGGLCHLEQPEKVIGMMKLFTSHFLLSHSS